MASLNQVTSFGSVSPELHVVKGEPIMSPTRRRGGFEGGQPILRHAGRAWLRLVGAAFRRVTPEGVAATMKRASW